MQENQPQTTKIQIDGHRKELSSYNQENSAWPYILHEQSKLTMLAGTDRYIVSKWYWTMI